MQHFNPEIEPTPTSVRDLQKQLSWSDSLIISSPEYAHGTPGVLKNALNWLVSGEEFVSKPTALFNASPRAIYAIASLTEIVTTMSGKIVPEASVTVSILGKNLDATAIVNDSEISSQLQVAIVAFAAAINELYFKVL